MKKNVSVSFMLMGILFCVCLITANLLATKLLHIGSIDFSLFGLPVKLGDFTVTAGILIFPISYVINDCIAEIWGYKKARLIIWTGFAMNFFVVCLGLIAVHIPGASFWNGEEHFNFIFNFAPRVVAASLLSFLVGSFLNAYVMSVMKVKSKGKGFGWRAVVSTLIGEGGDSLIFFPVAFFGMIPNIEILKLMCVQVILKTLYEIIVLPLTTIIVMKLKKFEETDVYDTDISYNPLNFKEL